MKSIYYIIGVLIFIIIFSILCYALIIPGTEIKMEKDYLVNQNELEEKYLGYGYTIDNPNIIINPYEISPLSALISFETDDYVEITVSIKEKDNSIKKLYTTKKNIIHYLPIYMLYSNYNNEVIISYINVEKTIDINIPEIDLKGIDYSICINDFNIGKTNNYLYACDMNSEIRWILMGNYNSNIIQKSTNNHLITSTDQTFTDNVYTGIKEIDYLGKTYFEYITPNGYYGLSYIKEDNNILILSKNKIFELDNQNGSIVKSFDISNNDWNYLYYNYSNNTINLIKDDEQLEIDYNTKKDNYIDIIDYKNEQISFYNNANYRVYKAVRFNHFMETKIVKTHISLLNYKEDSLKDMINITYNSQRVEFLYDFNNKDTVYIILDNFMHKKIYEIDTNEKVFYINNTNLSGKYSVYIKINKKLYKLNKYINFS